MSFGARRRRFRFSPNVWPERGRHPSIERLASGPNAVDQTSARTRTTPVTGILCNRRFSSGVLTAIDALASSLQKVRKDASVRVGRSAKQNIASCGRLPDTWFDRHRCFLRLPRMSKLSLVRGLSTFASCAERPRAWSAAPFPHAEAWRTWAPLTGATCPLQKATTSASSAASGRRRSPVA